ncbi:MAG: MCE family protein [Betaproteobacteria bacterium]|nr:MCE family protein [Betaproteobacteria bacterium]
MTDQPPPPPRPALPDDIPEPLLESRRPWLPSLVWAIPILAALIGISLVVQVLMARGPTITISFASAEGIEPGKTKVKFREVDIGEVRTVRLAQDGARIVATVELTKEATRFAVDDSRFWVVRPRLAGGGISGLGTLVSGAYIGVDGGKSEERRREFAGLDEPPVVPADVPGRSYVLRADDLGSLDIGSPIFHRRVQVGQVTGFTLAPDGSDVSLRIFVKAPHDRLIGPNTRFWHASGVDLSLDAGGVKVNTQSLAAVLLGGIAFANPPDATVAEPAPAETSFALARDETRAMKAPDGEPVVAVLRFNQSVRGLVAGAPVDFRGVVLGSVRSVNLDFNRQRREFAATVVAELFPARLARGADSPITGGDPRQRAELLSHLIRRGLRAQLRTGNLLTGQLYVALDFFPRAAPVQADVTARPLELPTVPGDLEELQQRLADIINKLDKVPFDAIGADLRQVLASMDATLKRAEALAARLDAELMPEVRSSLAELRRTLGSAGSVLADDAPLQQEARESLRELSAAARALRALTDTLEHQPESLLRGKSGDPK